MPDISDKLVWFAKQCLQRVFGQSAGLRCKTIESERRNRFEDNPGKDDQGRGITDAGVPDEVSANGRQFINLRKYEVALTFPGGQGAGKQPNPATRYLLRLDFDEKGIVSRRYFTAPYEYQDKPVQGYPPYSSR